MATATPETVDGFSFGGGGGGYAPGGTGGSGGGGSAPGGINPATSPSSPTGVTVWQGVMPVLYPAPTVPNQPGTGTGTPVTIQPPQPPQPVDCAGCGDATPAGPGATLPVGTIQPVLKQGEPTAAPPCEVCLWLRSRPWWWWLIVLVVLYLIYRGRS